MTISAVCQEKIAEALPRLFGLFNRNRVDELCGVGDRYFSAWKLIDFANGTYQGSVYGLSLLYLDAFHHGDTQKAAFLLNLITSSLSATKQMMRANGSFEEAYPYEASYCVTALVAHDVLSAMRNLRSQLPPAIWQEHLVGMKPAIEFLCAGDETHAFISNHLATAAAAIFLWNDLASDQQSKGQELLDRILDRQSEDGWYDEYGGADPGYQTLCMHYLLTILELTDSERLRDSLLRSIAFLSHFIHPDGSFGGLYGSRNTRFFYPSAFHYFSLSDPFAAAVCAKMARAIQDQAVVGLAMMDDTNLIPMFNAYARTGFGIAKKRENAAEPSALAILPAEAPDFVKNFVGSGLYVRKAQDLYFVSNLKKGGVSTIFKGKQLAQIDPGVLCRFHGRWYSGQQLSEEGECRISDAAVELRYPLAPIGGVRPTPLLFTAFRLLNISFMRFAWVNELIKKILVRWMIKKNLKKPAYWGRRIFTFDASGVHIMDEIPQGFETVRPEGIFYATHMASQGYWQANDLIQLRTKA